MATTNRLNSFGNRMNNFSKEVSETKTNNVLRSVKCSDIVENPYNATIFSMDNIDALSESMKERGDIEPIRLLKTKAGKYEILSGHRRFRAHVANGDTNVDAIVVEGLSESQAISEMILANILARRLTPIEDARAMRLYIDKVLPDLRETEDVSGKSKDILAKLWGISASSVSRRLSLLKLNADLQKLLEAGTIDFMAFIPLTQCDEATQAAAYEKIKKLLESEEEESAVTRDAVEGIIAEIAASKNAEEKEPQKRVKSTTTKTQRNLAALLRSLEKEDLPSDESAMVVNKKNIARIKQLKDQLEEAIRKFEEQ